jgi:hypothetical protein
MIKSLRAMLAAGASAELIVLAVEAAYKAEDDRKARQTEYMREYRKGVRLRNITPPSSPPMINNSTPSPTSDLAKAKSIKSLSDQHLFECFWTVYPRKVGKGAARKAYRNALKRASHAEIMAGAKAYAASKPDPQFTAHASTWLNADRWLDEPDRKPSTVLSGPWKPIEPEKMPEPISPAELARRQEQIRKAKAALCKKP